MTAFRYSSADGVVTKTLNISAALSATGKITAYLRKQIKSTQVISHSIGPANYPKIKPVELRLCLLGQARRIKLRTGPNQK